MNSEQLLPLSFQHVMPELRLYLGDGSLDALRRELEKTGARRAVVICGRTISRSHVLDLLRNALGTKLVGVCAAVREHSPIQAVEEAVQFLEDIERGGAACPDLFLLDLNLPRLDGAEVLRRLRLVDGCANVPVIVMTSSDYRGDKERVGRLGVELYFLKTASLEEFMKLGPAVRGVLYNRRQES